MPISKEDKKIVEQIIRKDERALLNFYKHHHQKILLYIIRQLKDTHLAEEITQDVFLDFIENIRDFRGESSIKTFLFTIARNKIIDHIRKKKIKKILFSAIPSFIVEGLATVVMDEEIEKKELTRKIKRVFDHLPNDYRIILRLKYLDGEKVMGIAKKLSLNFKATESLLFRARRAFVKIFKSTA